MQKKKEEIRERILAAAMEEFLERSYGGASLRRIAEKAGLSKGAIYSYFETKDRLFTELAGPATRLLEESLTRYPDRDGGEKRNFDSTEENIKNFKAFARAVLEYRDAFRLTLFCAAGSGLENYKETIIQLYSRNALEWMPVLMRRKDAFCIISEMFIHTLASIYISFLEEIILHDPDPAEVESYAEQMAIFVHSGIQQLGNMD